MRWSKHQRREEIIVLSFTAYGRGPRRGVCEVHPGFVCDKKKIIKSQSSMIKVIILITEFLHLRLLADFGVQWVQKPTSKPNKQAA